MADKTMIGRIVVCVVALCLLIFFRVMPVAGRAAEFDIRFADGKIAIAADKIRSYEWATHTITLAPGTRAELRGGHLVSGIPFAVTVREKTIYTGSFTTAASSRTFSTPVIVVDEQIVDPTLKEDQIRIARGYPTSEYFRGADPRADPRVRDALKADGKLVPYQLVPPRAGVSSWPGSVE